MTKVKPSLSQNSLVHSFMSASFFVFNQTYRGFLVRKHWCAAGRQGLLESAKHSLREQLQVCSRKSWANGCCVGMLSSSSEEQS